jgi:regulator of sirC expression with transglutaminase-like and TPR domain
MKEAFVQRFAASAASADRDLATPALMIAALERPSLDPVPYLAKLDAMGASARDRLVKSGCLNDARKSEGAVEVLNAYVFDEEGFTGNQERYDDPSNSFLSDVLERRTGIPITLAVVYMEVARRAGVHMDGVNFPGHFLMRYPPHRNERGENAADAPAVSSSTRFSAVRASRSATADVFYSATSARTRRSIRRCSLRPPSSRC